MEFRRVLALRGPNIWARFPVLEAWVDLGPLKDSPSDEMPGFNQRLMTWLPTLVEHRCSVGERGGFFERLRRGTYLAHILEHVTLELQTLAGSSVGFGKARETSEEGVYKVAIRYHEESLARAALETARALCLAAVYDQPFEVVAEVQRLRELADRVCLGPSTSAIVDAAVRRGIPYRRLNAGSLVLLGQGVKQRRIWTAETDRTSAIAESIAQDKALTKSMLRAAGVPVPEGRVVDSPEDAWSAAEECGLPVVVKPRDANHGRGVFAGLTEREQVARAYVEAGREGSGVIVERFAPGVEHRLLIVGQKMVAASRGEEIRVIGDGQQTIEQLVASQVNSDPRRGPDETFPLTPVMFIPKVLLELERQGFTPLSVPPAGANVLIQRDDNLTTDVTDLVHAQVAEQAVLAAQLIGLDVAGIDLVATDISQPLEQQGGAVVEVNAGPGLLMHLKPAVGQPRPVGEAIVSTMFPEAENGRIPVVAVTGTNGKSTVTRLLSHLLRGTGRTVGMTCSEGVYIDGRRIEAGDCSGPRSARNVLLNPLVEAAVFEVGRGGILREGLGFDKCDVAVVTNIHTADHLGRYDIQTAEQMFTVKRTPVDVVLPTGTAVLNADDSLVANMAPLSAGSVTFFARDADHPVVAEHCSAGRRAVVVGDGTIELRDGAECVRLLPLDQIPLLQPHQPPFQVENVLAAVAAAWGLSLSPEQIVAGLTTFACDLDDCPARFNVLPLRDRMCIFDDCRNAAALKGVVAALDRFPEQRRTAIYACAADQCADDILAQVDLLARAFDRVIVYPPDETAARSEPELLELLQRQRTAGQRVGELLAAPGWDSALDQGFSVSLAGELLFVQIGTVSEAVRRMRAELAPSGGADGAADRGDGCVSAACSTG